MLSPESAYSVRDTRARNRNELSKSLLIDVDALTELQQEFPTLQSENFIERGQLGKAMALLGFPLAGYELRDLEKQIHPPDSERITGECLMMLHARIKESKDVGRTFKPIKKIDEDENLKKMVPRRSESTAPARVISQAEERGYAEWINRILREDADCIKDAYLPIDVSVDGDLYARITDGLVLCKLINSAAADTIDERAINKGRQQLQSSIFKRNENLTLVINSAESIGCKVVNIGAEDIAMENRYLVLGLIWQVIRIGLLSMVNVIYNPNIELLLEEDETLEELRLLSNEEILQRWVNYHLAKAGVNRRITNFREDIQDSEVYAVLLEQIAPVDKRDELLPSSTIIAEKDTVKRAGHVLSNADSLNAKVFLQPEDIAKVTERGKNRDRLNLAFVANLFNTYPALVREDTDNYDRIEETLEEKTYRNWMNSLGVNPFVKDISADLRNGLILLQLMDILQPGCVDWTKTIRIFSSNKSRRPHQMQANCTYLVEVMKQQSALLKVINLAGGDIYKGEKKLNLGVCFQLMRSYTLKMLTKLRGDGKPIDDKEIIAWANAKLEGKHPTSQIKSFSDPIISTGRPVIDLVETLRPGSVKYEVVSETEKESNCRYAISIARRIGARVYALPQHLLDANPKMTMTVFACLMVLDLQLNMSAK